MLITDAQSYRLPYMSMRLEISPQQLDTRASMSAKLHYETIHLDSIADEKTVGNP